MALSIAQPASAISINNQVAAAVGGIAYAFGGFAVGQVGHLNQISAAAWLPAVLLTYHRFATRQQIERAVTQISRNSCD